MEPRRHVRVPAFGEWNYYHYCDEMPKQEGSSDLWFKYSPPPRKQAKKVRREGVPEKQHHSGEQKKKARQARVADAGAHAPAKAKAVVRAVDDDLYQVHPDLLSVNHHRRRVARRRLWMGGCLGLSCVA